jgi:hypothetical protein
MSSLENIEISEFNVFTRGTTDLLAINKLGLEAVSLERVFFLIATEPDLRGAHAHISCTQWFAILSGSASLSATDGVAKRNLELNRLGEIVKVPSGIWVEVNILEPSVIAVFADLDFDERDYIRDWESFIKYKGVA